MRTEERKNSCASLEAFEEKKKAKKKNKLHLKVIKIKFNNKQFGSAVKAQTVFTMTFFAHLTIWTYIELFAYVCIYKKCFTVLRNQFDNWFFMAKWSIGRGTALGLANLIISGLFGLGASLSGFTILYLRLKNSKCDAIAVLHQQQRPKEGSK